MRWILITIAFVALGFLVGRFALPLLIFCAWLVYYVVAGRHRAPDDDVSGILWFALMLFAVGGTTVGVIARYVARWVRRARVKRSPS